MANSLLWDNFFAKSMDESIFTLLKSIPLFDNLKRNELAQLERSMHLRDYNTNEVIFSEGDPGAALYIIKSGEIEIYKNYERDPIKLVTLSSGMFFGEMALFDESPRSATAIASKKCELLALSEPDLSLFSQKNAKIGLKIITRLGQILSARLRAANEQIEHYEKQKHENQ